MNFSRRQFLAILLLVPGLLLAEIKDGNKTVTAAGTAEALGSNESCVWVTVQAAPGNTGNIYVGASTVSSTRGVELAPGDSQHFSMITRGDHYNLAEIWVDAATSADTVKFIYQTR